MQTDAQIFWTHILFSFIYNSNIYAVSMLVSVWQIAYPGEKYVGFMELQH